jgi:ketosteroid isomerase-like protein
MEAQLTGLPVATLLRELPAVKEYILSAQEITDFIRQLKDYATDGTDQQLLHKALAKIKTSLKESLSLVEVDEKQLLALCQLLDKINHFELLRYCAKIALDSWENPIWKYYQVYAETKGLAEQCQQVKIMRLEKVREQAMQEKYHRAVVLIDSFIARYYQVHPERNMDFLDGLFAADIEQEIDESEDPLVSLFGHIPEPILRKLDKKLESLLRKTSPEMLVDQLKKEIGEDAKVMSAMMQQPDLFTALLMQRAARDLGIDIDVSIGDVLDIFGVEKQTDLFSLPF